MRTNHSSVPIVALLSRTALRIKSFTNPGVIPMSQNAVPNAVKKGSQSATETVAIAIDRVRCFLQYAQIVVVKLKYRLSPVRADQCIAAIATVK